MYAIRSYYGFGVRHGELGQLVWHRFLPKLRGEVSSRAFGSAEVCDAFVEAVFGHHGTPCVERQDLPHFDREDLFTREGLADCEALAAALVELLGADAARNNFV